MLCSQDHRPPRRAARRSLFATGALLAAALASPRPARAQSAAEDAARRLLIEQAQHESDAGHHARALELAAQAAAIRMTPSLRLWIAEEEHATGKLAEAFVSADACAREAEARPTLPNRAAIVRRCRELATEVRHAAGIVVVRVPGVAPAGLRVRVAGHALGPTLLGVPYLVAPGTVLIEAEAPGAPRFRRSVLVAAGQHAEVALTLDGPLAPVAQSSSGGGPLLDAPGPVDGGRRRGIPVGAVALAGGGVATLGAAAVFYALRQDALGGCAVGDTQIGCPTASDAARARDAYTYNTLTNVALGVGVAAVVGGALWFALDRASHRDAPPRRASVLLAPTRDGAVLGLHGAL